MTGTQAAASPSADSAGAAVAEYVCRFCGGIAVTEGSTCPHCGREVMALCPQCKRYVDNQLELCDRCSTPLAAVGQIGRALRGQGEGESQAVTLDVKLGLPPRTLTATQWRQILALPAVVVMVALITAAIVFNAVAQAQQSGDTETSNLALVPLFLVVGYLLFSIAVAISTMRFHRRLFVEGQAVVGQITEVHGRRMSARGFSQLVRFSFVDLRGSTRGGTVKPISSIKALRPGADATVLYLADEPAQSTIYPFMF